MKVLILGIGNAQTDLLKLLAGDHEVHAISYTSEGRGKDAADYFEIVDIRDEQQVLNYAKDHHIDLVCSAGSDIAMVTSAVVSEELNLPSFVSSRTAKICHAKDRLREHMGNFGGNVQYSVVEKLDDIPGIAPAYPLIIKPVDSQGQRGVFLVHDESEFRDKFPRSMQFSPAKRIIAEEYIDGPEISVNCYLVDGDLSFFIISDRITWPDLPGGIIHKHIIPSAFSGTPEEDIIRQFVLEVIRRLGIADGPLYLQMKIGSGGPRLIEVTPRLDGCHLWRLIRHATGVDLLDIYTAHITNRILPPEKMDYELLKGPWVLEFMCEKPGTVFDKSGFNVDGAVYLEWYYEDGEKVKPMNHYMEKCGYCIFRRS
jgi:biotin carboxylase